MIDVELEPALAHGTSPDAGTVRGVVLMLHGGAEHGLKPVDESSLSWRRSRWMMQQIQDDLHREGLAVSLLRYRVKGWNAGAAATPAPVDDARWALDELAQQHAGLPITLLGHSMGARTAVAVADHPAVVGVVALAPWFPPGEPVTALRGRHLVAAHGSADKITSARATRAYIRRASEIAASAEFVDMGRVGHYMLRRRSRWNRVAAERTVALFEA